ANSTVLLTRLLYRKHTYNEKIYLLVDGAITELIRPTLYQAHHDIFPAEKRDGEITADVVGPVCESGDFFARARKISDVKEGDYLAVMSSGAYASVMGSNYNARLKPAEVMVDGKTAKLIRKRQTFEQLIQDEVTED
ncbi:MAG: diaminopimelate decarboxylase, partial [Chlorobiales bacterium]|nr:diaminopimelate decarboxylase [Chlorobiales bacterium]